MSKKKASLKAIEAMRNNATRSAGPKKLRGKKDVRANAIYQGLLAREIVITRGDGKEASFEFRRLLESLNQTLLPEGALEDMLVEKIAACHWRLRRVLRFETGAIRARLDTGRDDYFNDLFWRAIIRHPARTPTLRENSCELEVRMIIVNQAREEMQSAGYLSEPSWHMLAKFFGQDRDSLTQRCLSAGAGEQDGRGTAVLAVLDAETEQLNSRWQLAHERDQLRVESRLMSFSLPGDQDAQKVLRYEAAIERQFYRAIRQLERLQRRRMTEAPSPA